jgi:hypothetical protein
MPVSSFSDFARFPHRQLYRQLYFPCPSWSKISPVVPPSPSPLVPCSLCLTDEAELIGGREVNSRDDRRLKPLSPRRAVIIPLAHFFLAQTRCLGCVLNRASEYLPEFKYRSNIGPRLRLPLNGEGKGVGIITPCHSWPKSNSASNFTTTGWFQITDKSFVNTL